MLKSIIKASFCCRRVDSTDLATDTQRAEILGTSDLSPLTAWWSRSCTEARLEVTVERVRGARQAASYQTDDFALRGYMDRMADRMHYMHLHEPALGPCTILGSWNFAVSRIGCDASQGSQAAFAAKMDINLTRYVTMVFGLLEPAGDRVERMYEQDAALHFLRRCWRSIIAACPHFQNFQALSSS